MDLDQVIEPVKRYSRMWIKHKVTELQVVGAQFTYDLMGNLESYFEDDIEATKDDTTYPSHGEEQEEPRPLTLKGRMRS